MSWYSGLEHIVREAEPLASMTWFRLGGVAEFYAEPTTANELSELIKRCSQDNRPVRILGAGSRVLISDQGVQGLVIRLSAPEFCHITRDSDGFIAGGGAKLGHLVSSSVRDGQGGLESLVGIPGTVAGALKGNADSNGTSIGQWTTEVTVMKRDGSIETLGRDKLHFSYRQSNLDAPVILTARFILEESDTAELTRRMQTLWIVKRSNQPTSDEGHGQIFQDAQGIEASTLLEQAGLRNQKMGNAEVSQVNANFIVAKPGASSKEVTDLIDLMQQRVESELGVTLERELQIW